jgi:hypothetical protein
MIMNEDNTRQFHRTPAVIAARRNVLQNLPLDELCETLRIQLSNEKKVLIDLILEKRGEELSPNN